MKERRQVADLDKGVLSFASMTLIVGGLALAGLLFWGWWTGQSLPLWPALLVAGVNLLGAVKLVQETKAKQAAGQAAAAEAKRQAAAKPRAK
jgi:hypothetical protein